MSDQVFWFATRSAGILAWFAATVSVGVGLAMSSRVLGRRPTVPWLLDVHRFFSAMSVLFLLVHMLTLWLDSFVDFGLAELLIPGRAEVGGLSRLSMAWGVAAAWILFIVEGSSLIKKYLPPDVWQTLHLCSFGVVIMGLIHGLQTGSDTDNRILVVAAVSVLTAVTLLLGARVLQTLLDRRYRYDLALAEDGEPAPLAETDRRWRRSPVDPYWDPLAEDDPAEIDAVVDDETDDEPLDEGAWDGSDTDDEPRPYREDETRTTTAPGPTGDNAAARASIRYPDSDRGRARRGEPVARQEPVDNGQAPRRPEGGWFGTEPTPDDQQPATRYPAPAGRQRRARTELVGSGRPDERVDSDTPDQP